MQTLHSQKLFSNTSLSFFTAEPLYPPKAGFIIHFPHSTITDTTKGGAIADKSTKLLIGLPSAPLPSVPATTSASTQ